MNEITRPGSFGTVLLVEEARAEIAKCIAAEGLANFARRARASQSAVLRAAAGLEVHMGTATLIRLALEAP